MKEIRAYHEKLVGRLRALLGADLVGVYAGGSFALGGYTPGRSDLDVAAVCSSSLPSGLKTEVAAALRHESFPCPARGLELVVYAESSVRDATAQAAFEVDLNTGGAMEFTLRTEVGEASPHWYVIDRAILREHGRSLFGPTAKELFAPFSRDVLLRALSESVRWYEASPDAREDDAVLNACRAWRFAVEGLWSSKLDAGTWARSRLDDPYLVAHALAAYGGGRQLDRERVDVFLRRVLRLLEAT